MTYECEHLTQAAQRASGVTPSADGCEECLAVGDAWVHLRLCLSCGHVGCCDSSINRHATKHFRHSHHPVVRSFEPEEEWAYCYRDDAFVERLSAVGSEPAPRHDPAP